MEKTPMVHMMDYFNSEYKDAERVIKEKVRWVKPREAVDNAIQRCLGAAMFVQQLDETLSYDEVEQTYNFYKEQLEKLLE